MLTACSSRARRYLARIVARCMIFNLDRTGLLSRACQILNFENRTIIKGDTASFVKQDDYERRVLIPSPGRVGREL